MRNVEISHNCVHEGDGWWGNSRSGFRHWECEKKKRKKFICKQVQETAVVWEFPLNFPTIEQTSRRVVTKANSSCSCVRNVSLDPPSFFFFFFFLHHYVLSNGALSLEGVAHVVAIALSSCHHCFSGLPHCVLFAPACHSRQPLVCADMTHLVENCAACFIFTTCRLTVVISQVPKMWQRDEWIVTADWSRAGR